MGHGLTPWGGGPWGLGGTEFLQLLSALAIRENVVRLTFNEAPVFTGVLDPNDGSDSERYIVTPVLGTMMDGGDPRPVSTIIVARVQQAMSLGTIIDVTVDRPFDGYPGRYLVAVNQLISSVSGVLLDPLHSSLQFDGLVQVSTPKTLDVAVPIRDFANPQTLSGLLDPLPVTSDVGLLGSIPTGDDGDYAFDEGMTSYKKRLFRRLTSAKNRFAHLPGYGLGPGAKLKQLGKQSVRAMFEADAKQQVMQEPETIDASVNLIVDPNIPGLYRLKMRIKCKLSASPIDFNDVTFSVNG